MKVRPEDFLTEAYGEGNMVSLIQSNFYGFGSGTVVPGTGISLQNRAFSFSTNPDLFKKYKAPAG